MNQLNYQRNDVHFLADGVPSVVFCLLGLFHRDNRICEDLKFLTNVCHKHDVF